MGLLGCRTVEDLKRDGPRLIRNINEIAAQQSHLVHQTQQIMLPGAQHSQVPGAYYAAQHMAPMAQIPVDPHGGGAYAVDVNCQPPANGSTAGV